MPIIKSAKKRVRQTNRARARNNTTRTNIRSAVKKLQASIASKKNPAEALRKAQSTLDIGAKKGVMHKNKVARKQRQLAAAAKAAGMKITAVKSAAPAKKAATKPAAKKAVAKKPTTKKK